LRGWCWVTLRKENRIKIGRLIVRLVVGGLFIGHGTQKLYGWFGGPGPAGTEQMMQGLNMHPPRRNALAAGATASTATVELGHRNAQQAELHAA